MSLVIEASVTLAWFFEDERAPAVDAVLDRVAASGAMVPPLWRLEVANGLQVGIRRKRIDSGFRDRALERLAALSVAIDNESDSKAWTSILQLADQFSLTLYDASYLGLAPHRHQLPLASLDRALRGAGQALKLDLLGVEP